MPEEDKAPNPWEMIRSLVFRRFGVWGSILFFLIASTAWYIFTHWDAVNKWPGIAPIVAYISRQPVPKADPNRFTILVAHLENDPNHEYERLIIDEIGEFKETKVLSLDRSIALEGPDQEKQEKLGHESAVKYLKESGASVLIWGRVLSLSGKTVPKLYWTASRVSGLKSMRYNTPAIESQLRLPEVFWEDLSQILQLLIAKLDAEFQADRGRYVADRLPPFINRVRTLLKESEGHQGWNVNERCATRMILANALRVFGEQSGKKEPLEEAVSAYHEALKEQTRERVPLDWAIIQNNLGNALSRLGERESGTERLEEAVSAYHEALKERTREQVPLDWAMTQNNLGNALSRLGERESGTARLEEAVSAYRSALSIFKQGQATYYVEKAKKNLDGVQILIQQRKFVK